MTDVTIDKIKEIQTLEELEALNIGSVICDISYRGGVIGFYSTDIAEAFEVSTEDLPPKFGAYCNYLGGGIRGTISVSGFNKKTILDEKAELLVALGEACGRVYINLEDEDGINEELYEDGEPNWDAIATKKSRDAGIESAY